MARRNGEKETASRRMGIQCCTMGYDCSCATSALGDGHLCWPFIPAAVWLADTGTAGQANLLVFLHCSNRFSRTPSHKPLVNKSDVAEESNERLPPPAQSHEAPALEWAQIGQQKRLDRDQNTGQFTIPAKLAGMDAPASISLTQADSGQAGQESFFTQSERAALSTDSGPVARYESSVSRLTAQW